MSDDVTATAAAMALLARQQRSACPHEVRAVPTLAATSTKLPIDMAMLHAIVQAMCASAHARYGQGPAKAASQLQAARASGQGRAVSPARTAGAARQWAPSATR